MATELKSYTIVPDGLYVERKADKQLHNIVEAMQRPGYVLVSRQMGKTNLLLRAKRKWENSDDLYVYIDMSNADETEKGCFESLIDTAIDTHEEILSSVREKISDLRARNIIKSPVQAHNEELRVLLKAVKGRLVFILDEIDSLTRTSFSDNVFSQIRSTYFSRVNYPELEKLTYILSGVVEPTEIIKNPKISPFNIGEKIHLDDFSYEEYLTFVSQADLSWLGEEVIQRVYYWAEGNPRMTWDICYELQHVSEHNSAIVDALVKSMYLTSYDKTPIDTIRTLVKEDRDLRDAIIQMAYEKGNTLSDKIKSKLYLAGIVNYSDNNVRIKNRIIKDSLTLDWLQKIEEEEKGLLTYAIELHERGLYKDSVAKFEAYLKNNEFPETEAPFCYYMMGSCYYHLNEFEKSLEWLTKEMLDPQNSSDNYRHENLLSGFDCLKLSDDPDALKYFDNAMQGEKRDWIYYSAKLNSLTAQLRMSNGDESAISKIEDDYKALLALSDDPSITNVKLFASYQLASMYRLSNMEEACKYYDTALSYASDLAKPRILIDQYYVLPDEKRKGLLNELINVIKSVDSVPAELDPDKALELGEETFAKVLYVIYFYAYDRWDDVRDKLTLLPYTRGDSMYRMFAQAFYANDFLGVGARRLIGELYGNILSEDYNLSSDYHHQVYKFNAYLNQSESNAYEYVSSLKKSEHLIDSFGLVIVRNLAWSLFNRKEYKSIVQSLGWIIERYSANQIVQSGNARPLFDYVLMLSYFNLSDMKSAMEMSRLILSYIDDLINASSGNKKETLSQVKTTAQQVMSITSPHEPIRSAKKYNRNEKVRVRYMHSDEVIDKKYKQVEEDVINGRCVIIE